MKNRLAPISALAAVLSGCPSYQPIWSQQEYVVPVVGSLTESITPTEITVGQGASATVTVTLTPADGFTGLVQFSPVGSQPGCVLSPESIDIDGAVPVAISMTIFCAADSITGTQSVTLVAANSNQSAEAMLSLTVSAAQ